MSILKTALLAIITASIASLAAAGNFHQCSAKAKNLSEQWYVSVPAGAVAHSYVYAQCGQVTTVGYQFTNNTYLSGVVNGYTVYVNDSGKIDTSAEWKGDQVSHYATIQAGISGPPAGLVYLAQVNVTGFGATNSDEKWATLAGGAYTVWHGGGGDTEDAMVVAATDISW